MKKKIVNIILNASEKTINKVREIRESDYERRARWFWGTSGIAAVLIFSAWILFLNISVPPVPGSEIARESETTEHVSSQSIFETFRRGAAVVGGDISREVKNLSAIISNGFNSIRNRLENKEKSTTEKQQRNFVFESLEKIPPTPLP